MARTCQLIKNAVVAKILESVWTIPHFALTPKVETLHVALAQIKIGDPEFRLFSILEELN